MIRPTFRTAFYNAKSDVRSSQEFTFSFLILFYAERRLIEIALAEMGWPLFEN
jgi:hypothetical protein